MDLNRLTQKTQEALSAAQSLAVEHGHPEVDGEHLLHALLSQQDGLLPRLLTKMDVNVEALTQGVQKEIDRRPRVSGPGMNPGSIFVSQRLSKLLVNAEQQAKRLKDEYVSVEHVFMALLDEGSRTETGRLLNQFGITQDRFLKALTDVRGNQRVTSANPEATYEALERYGRDLVKAARTGKL
ncbi:MAG TPA: Clp protease N-terminal domain-containing protein, partial [Candidatus Sumerlaeota bacterium]|nr:Clp protease N-terminal domain-containing protein [Candidatus Sumerlaeota bacterium]